METNGQSESYFSFNLNFDEKEQIQNIRAKYYHFRDLHLFPQHTFYCPIFRQNYFVMVR